MKLGSSGPARESRDVLSGHQILRFDRAALDADEPAQSHHDPVVTATNRTVLSPVAQWIIWFVFGAANALLLGIGGLIPVIVLLVLALRVATRGDRLSSWSGLLVGLGTTWLALVGRQFETGGRLDDPYPWLALGAVPLALGAGLGVVRLIHRDGAR